MRGFLASEPYKKNLSFFLILCRGVFFWIWCRCVLFSIDPIGALPSNDPFANWITNFQFAYALTDLSRPNLSGLEIGFLRNFTGNGLSVRKITSEMLTNNAELANQVHRLALKGLLGFKKENEKGVIHFRKDIAELLGKRVKDLTIINQNNSNWTKEISAKIGSLELESYASLAGLEIGHLLDVEQEAQPKTEKKRGSSQELKVAQSSSSPYVRAPVLRAQQKRLTTEVAERILDLLRAQEKDRIKYAAEKREAQKKRDREEIKDEILKKETQNTEIKNQEIKSF